MVFTNEDKIMVKVLRQDNGFPLLILKYLNFKNCSANFVQKCKIYSKEVLVNEIIGKIKSDKFSCSDDDLYSGVTFLSHR